MKILLLLIKVHEELGEHNKSSVELHSLREVQKNVSSSNYTEIFNNIFVLTDVAKYYMKIGLNEDAHLLERLAMSVVTGKSMCFMTSNQLELNDIYNAVNEMYEVGWYTMAVEIGMDCLSKLRSKPSNTKEVKQFQILIGKAMFDGGNCSKGRDQMESALQEIESLNLPYDQERKTACWYLIPRFKYIETCYGVSKIPLSLLFSPTPLPSLPNHVHFDPISACMLSIKSIPVGIWKSISACMLSILVGIWKSIKAFMPLDSKSDTTELIQHSTSAPLDRNLYIEYWWQLQDFYSESIESESTVFILDQLCSVMISYYRDFYYPVWIFMVWIKLLHLVLAILFLYNGYQDFVSSLYMYHYYYIFIPLVVILYCFEKSDYSLKQLLQALRDPRFMYCDEVSPLVRIQEKVTKSGLCCVLIVTVMVWIVAFSFMETYNHWPLQICGLFCDLHCTPS